MLNCKTVPELSLKTILGSATNKSGGSSRAKSGMICPCSILFCKVCRNTSSVGMGVKLGAGLGVALGRGVAVITATDGAAAPEQAQKRSPIKIRNCILPKIFIIQPIKYPTRSAEHSIISISIEDKREPMAPS